MKRAIFYKEWIKTRRFFGLAAVGSVCFVVYALLRVNRVIEMKGVGHLWEILLQKDVVFIDILQYMPLAIGLLLAIVQFVPEMLQKRLKLTLHLPYPHRRMVLLMLVVGLVLLTSLFVVNYIIMGIYFPRILAPELSSRILLTSLPWYLAGIAAYVFVAWVCLEPTWRRRILNVLVAVSVLCLFFLSDAPQAYDPILWLLVVLLACITGFSLLSVSRFKEGRQD